MKFKRLVPWLIAPFRTTFGPSGLAFASPAFAYVAAYLLAYGVGLIAHGPQAANDLGIIVVAIITGFFAFTIGMAAGWRLPIYGRHVPPPVRWRSTPRGPLIWVAAALLIVGIAAAIQYLMLIGELPIFMPSLEQGRVEAAERGGAPLRVLALLALPGAWLLLAQGVATQSMLIAALGIGSVSVVAVLQLVTANRAPAFLLVEVAVVAALLTAGKSRLGPRGLTMLGSLMVVLVLAAGLIGAYRLAATPELHPPARFEEVRRNWIAQTPNALGNYLRVPVQNFQYTLEAVPELMGWRLGFTYLQPVLTVLPGTQTTFDQDLKAALQQTYPGGGTVPSFLGESYANFGPLGWILMPALLGLILAWLYRRASLAASPEWWVLYGFLIVHAANATLSGLSVANIFPTMAIIILLFTAELLPRLRYAARARRTIHTGSDPQ